MTNIFKDSRRDLRERAFQTLFALEFGGEALEQAHFAYTYDKPIYEETEVDVPAFLLSLVTGVREELAQLDSQIEEKLKEGWSLSRLIVTDRTLLRLGLYEITSFEETPGRVAINEIIEIAKKYKDKLYKDDNELKKDLDKIKIFIPITSSTVDEDSISFDGSGNSFLEVGELVFKDDSQSYHEFVKLVKKLK
mgnify:CR=1 FL=1